jgi:hypothetical protein
VLSLENNCFDDAPDEVKAVCKHISCDWSPGDACAVAPAGYTKSSALNAGQVLAIGIVLSIIAGVLVVACIAHQTTIFRKCRGTPRQLRNRTRSMTKLVSVRSVTPSTSGRRQSFSDDSPSRFSESSRHRNASSPSPTRGQPGGFHTYCDFLEIVGPNSVMDCCCRR